MFSNAFSVGASGLRAMSQQVDIRSANIANANTPGYRRRDVASETLLGGGVTNVVTHRFNQATAQRLSVLAGETSYADNKAKGLTEAEDIISDATTQVSEAQTKFNELAYRASLTPSEPGLREQLAASANALALVANEGINGLDKQLTHMARDINSVKEQAQLKMDELTALNKEAWRTGPTPALRDRQAQVGKELAELVGGEVRFEDNGSASFMLNNKFLLYGNTQMELPENTGGKLQGLKDARENVTAYRDSLTTNLDNFANTVNGLNAGGIDGNGAAGQPVFAMNMGKLQYVGDAQGKAFAAQSAAPGVESPTQAMAGMTTLGEDFVATVVDATGDAAAARSVSAAVGSTLSRAEEQQAAQEGVDIDTEMIALKLAQRIYEANAKVIQTADSMMGTLLSIKA